MVIDAEVRSSETFDYYVAGKMRFNHNKPQKISQRALRLYKILVPAVLLFFMSAGSFVSSGQPLNYPEIFGDDWKKAEQFVADNEEWIKPLIEKYKIDYKEAIAVIFPELVRYSALRDVMEITLLKALYINLGKDYANFSVGMFQMKPSFAEAVISESEKLGGKWKRFFTDSTGYKNQRAFRADIVKSLENTRSQVLYLVLFFRICEHRFNLPETDSEGRVRFLAAAYNYGFWNSPESIKDMEGRKFFSVKLTGKAHWSYSDVSVYWYLNNSVVNK